MGEPEDSTMTGIPDHRSTDHKLKPVIEDILLYILAVFVSPIPVMVKAGFGSHFCLNVVLWFLLPTGLLLSIPHAWWIIATAKERKQHSRHWICLKTNRSTVKTSEIASGTQENPSQRSLPVDLSRAGKSLPMLSQQEPIPVTESAQSLIQEVQKSAKEVVPDTNSPESPAERELVSSDSSTDSETPLPSSGTSSGVDNAQQETVITETPKVEPVGQRVPRTLTTVGTPQTPQIDEEINSRDATSETDLVEKKVNPEVASVEQQDRPILTSNDSPSTPENSRQARSELPRQPPSVPERLTRSTSGLDTVHEYEEEQSLAQDTKENKSEPTEATEQKPVIETVTRRDGEANKSTEEVPSRATVASPLVRQGTIPPPSTPATPGASSQHLDEMDGDKTESNNKSEEIADSMPNGETVSPNSVVDNVPKVDI